jgi:hypothetical protein
MCHQIQAGLDGGRVQPDYTQFFLEAWGSDAGVPRRCVQQVLAYTFQQAQRLVMGPSKRPGTDAAVTCGRVIIQPGSHLLVRISL